MDIIVTQVLFWHPKESLTYLLLLVALVLGLLATELRVIRLLDGLYCHLLDGGH